MNHDSSYCGQWWWCLWKQEVDLVSLDGDGSLSGSLCSLNTPHHQSSSSLCSSRNRVRVLSFFYYLYFFLVLFVWLSCYHHNSASFRATHLWASVFYSWNTQHANKHMLNNHALSSRQFFFVLFFLLVLLFFSLCCWNHLVYFQLQVEESCFNEMSK